MASQQAAGAAAGGATPGVAGAGATTGPGTPVPVVDFSPLKGLVEELLALDAVPEARLKALHRILDFERNSNLSDSAYTSFTQAIIQALVALLHKVTRPTFERGSTTQVLRNSALHLLHRLPMTADVLRPRVQELLGVVSALLEEENEDNCEILLKLVLDILRGFRPGQCDPSVIRPFLATAQKMFERFYDVVQTTFGSFAQSSLADLKSQCASAQQVLDSALRHMQAAMTQVQAQTTKVEHWSKLVRKAQAQEDGKVTDPTDNVEYTAIQAQIQLAQMKYEEQQLHHQLLGTEQAERTARSKVDQLHIRLREASQDASQAESRAGHQPLSHDASRIPMGLTSFKVLAECPIIIVVAMQVFGKPTQETGLPQFLPLAMRILRDTRGPPINAPPHITSIYADFVSTQIKTLSFLAYALPRGLAAKIKPPVEHLPLCILHLLRDTPPTATALRRELIVACRHILNLDFIRTAFAPHLESFLDERVLSGVGWSSRELLKPLMYSTMADLVHHLRSDLTPAQAAIAIHLYLRAVMDNGMQLSIQAMSCRLVLNLIEGVVAANDRSSRVLLLHMLNTFVAKLGSLASLQVPRMLRYYKKRAASARAKNPGTAAAAAAGTSSSSATTDGDDASTTMSSEQAPPPDTATLMDTDGAGGAGDDEGQDAGHAAAAGDGDTDPPLSEEESQPQIEGAKQPDGSYFGTSADSGMWTPIHSRTLTPDHIDSVKDGQYLINQLVRGIYNILWGLAQLKPPGSSSTTAGAGAGATSSSSGSSRVLSMEEVPLCVQLLQHGLTCLTVFELSLDGSVRPRNPAGTTNNQEEKDTIERFGKIFTLIDGPTFREAFQTEMPLLVKHILRNPALMMLTQQLLSDKGRSTFFATKLLEHLLQRLPELAEAEAEDSGVLLRLFKLVFGSVSLMPDLNEVVLQPSLSEIVHRCMRQAAVVSDPKLYFLLLRALFRSIGGGKFDHLYREFLPLLPALLNGLNRLQDCVHTQEMQDLVVELCLTVPVRLSALLPYLHYLMRPLVEALQSPNSELVSQGLRTLGLCIENLAPAFFDPIIDPVRGKLMAALWTHLKPVSRSSSSSSSSSSSASADQQLGPVVLRILGKLGGRARLTLAEPAQLHPRTAMEHGLRLPLTFEDTVVHLPVDRAVEVALEVIADPPDAVSRQEAVIFLKNCLAAMLPLDTAPHDMSCLASALETQHTSGGVLQALPTAAGASMTEDAAPADADAGGGSAAAAGAAGGAAPPQPFFAPDAPEGSPHMLLRTILVGLMSAMTDPDLRDDVLPLLQHAVRHCVLVSVHRHLHERPAQPGSPPAAPTGTSGAATSSSSSSSNSSSPAMPPLQTTHLRSKEIDACVVVDAVVTCLTSKDRNAAAFARPLLDLLLETAQDLMGSLEQACELDIVAALNHYICAACYAPAWFSKSGACTGIDFLVTKMPESWLRSRQLKLNRSLLFVAMMDLVDQSAADIVRRARQLMDRLVDRVFAKGPFVLQTDGVAGAGAEAGAGAGTASGSVSTPAVSTPTLSSAPAQTPTTPIPATPTSATPASTGSNSKQETELGKLVKLLAIELPSAGSEVRAQVKHTLERIAELSSMGVSALLQHTMLPRTVLPKTSRSSPIGLQVGRMDALAYCLSLSPPLLMFQPSPEIEGQAVNNNTNYFNEIKHIADVRSQLRPPSHVPPQVMVDLRVKALNLLAVVMQDAAWVKERAAVAGLFVAALSSEHDEVVQAALHGLEAMKTAPTIRNELKEALHPLLKSLDDYRKLTPAFLKSITRLEGFLSNTFNHPQLCGCLLQHLRRWLQQVVDEHETQGALGQGQGSIASACAILEVFAQVEPHGGEYLRDIIEAVVHAEIGMQTRYFSPFRPALGSYLCKYPQATLDFFFERLGWNSYAQLFVALLEQPNVDPLLDDLSARGAALLMRHVFEPGASLVGNAPSVSEQTTRSSLQFVGVRILLAALQHRPDILATPNHTALVESLQKIWISMPFTNRLHNEEIVPVMRIQEPRRLLECLLHYTRSRRDDIDVLFRLLSVFSIRTLVDTSCLHNFYYHEVAEIYPADIKRRVFFKVLKIFHDPGVPQNLKEHAVEKMLIPMLAASVVRGETEALLGAGQQGFVGNWFNLLLGGIHNAVPYDDGLKMGIIQFCAVLLQAARTDAFLLQELRQSQDAFVTFAWDNVCLGQRNWISPDPAVQFSGFVLMAMLSKTMKMTRSDILTYILDKLMVEQSSELRMLTRQAAVLLQPQLASIEKKRRSAGDGQGESQPESAAKHAKSAAAGEGGGGEPAAAPAFPEPSAGVPSPIEYPGSADIPGWIVLLKMTVVREIQNNSQLSHIWSLVTKCPRVYSTYRELLVPWLINSMTRLASASVLQTEQHRRTCLDIGAMLVQWETWAAENAAGGAKAKAEAGSGHGVARAVAMSEDAAARPDGESGTDSYPSTPAALVSSWRMPVKVQEQLLAILARVAYIGSDFKAVPLAVRQHMVRRSLEMIEQLLDSHVQRGNVVPIVEFPSKLLCQVQEANATLPPSIDMALRLLVVVQKQTPASKVLPLLCMAERGLINLAGLPLAADTLLPLYLDLLRGIVALYRPYGAAAPVAKAAAVEGEEGAEGTSQDPSKAAPMQQEETGEPGQTGQREVKEEKGNVEASGGVGKDKADIGDQAAAEVEVDEATKARLDQMYEAMLRVAEERLSARAGGSPLLAVRASVSVVEVLYNAQARLSPAMLVYLTTLLQQLYTDYTYALDPTSTAAIAAQQIGAGGAAPPPPLPLGDIVGTAMIVLRLLGRHVGELDQQTRRHFVATLVALMDKAQHPELIRVAADVIIGWVMPGPGAPEPPSVITPRDKGTLMLRLTNVYIRRFLNDAIFDDFLSRLREIYCDARLVNSEVTARLETGFMLGLRSESRATREGFFEILNAPLHEANLYTRFDYCLNDKLIRWDQARTCFWMKYVLDLMLAGAQRDAPLAWLSEADKVQAVRMHMPKLDMGDVAAEPAASKTWLSDCAEVDAIIGAAKVSAATKEVLRQYYAAQKTLAQVSMGGTVAAPLRTLCHRSPVLAHELWVDLFPALWFVLREEERWAIGEELQTLLAQDYLAESAGHQRANVAALLEGLAKCAALAPSGSPAYLLPPAQIYHLARTHNAWFTGASLLQQQLVRADSHNEKAAEGKLDPIKDALGDLYMQLGEEDTWFGMWRLRAKLRETTQALAYEQQGMWERAQACLESNMRLAATEPQGVREAEYKVWEEHWVGCTERLGEDELLLGYSEDSKDYELMLPSAWKLRNWNRAVLAVSKLEKQKDPMLLTKLVRAYVGMATSSVQQFKPAVEACFSEGANQALLQWSNLPQTVSVAHEPLLHQFQQLVEMNESKELLLNAFQTATSPTAQNLSAEARNIMETWRIRLPNTWDDMTFWQDICVWRLQVFDRLHAILQSTKPELAAKITQSDNAWTINQQAHVARLHSLRNVCQRTLQQIYKLPNVDVTSLFLKAKERVKCEMEAAADARDYQMALETINGISLQYFDAAQRAEIFALKGTVLQKLRQLPGARVAFATALSLCDSLRSGWEGWAYFSDQLFVSNYAARLKARREAERLKTGAGGGGGGGGGGDAGSTATSPAAAKLTMPDEAATYEYGMSAMACYLNASRSAETEEEARRTLARAIFLLSMDNKAGVIGSKFQELGDWIDPGFWKFWIPQLLTSLSRPEAKYVQNILLRLARQFPQALYYNLRTTFLDIRSSAQQSAMFMRRRSSVAPARAVGGAGGVKRKAGEDEEEAVKKEEERGEDREEGEGEGEGEEEEDGGGAEEEDEGEQRSKRARRESTRRKTRGSEAVAAMDTGADGGEEKKKKEKEREREREGGKVKSEPGAAAAGASAMTEDDEESKGGKSAGGSAGGGKGAAASGSGAGGDANALASQVLQQLRMRHSMLATAMETMIEEIISRFKPSSEEELLRTIRVLLTECMKQAFAALEQGGVEEARVPAQVATHLQRLMKSFFTPNNVAVLGYRGDFERDFAEVGSMTLDACMRKLREWHERVGLHVARMPRNFRLEDISRFLTNFSAAYSEVDLPGEHLDRHLNSSSLVQIHRFLPAVEVLHKHSAAFRRLHVRGSDGNRYSFLVQHAPARYARTEERLVHLFRIFNGLLDKKREARKRGLRFQTPRMVPLNTHVRLLLDQPNCTTLEDVFEEFSRSKQAAMDRPILYSYEMRRRNASLRRRYAQKAAAAEAGAGAGAGAGEGEQGVSKAAEGGGGGESGSGGGGSKGTPSAAAVAAVLASLPPGTKVQGEQSLKEIFDYIRRNYVPPDILTRHVRAMLSDHAELWSFKRTFTYQLAIMSFATNILLLSKGGPHTLKFSLESGCIVPWELAMNIDSNGQLHAVDRVPFRLTPNLVNFVTPVGITGPFSTALVAAAQALQVPEHRIQDQLGVVLRDEMICWFANHSPPWTKGGLDSETLVLKVNVNANIILRQLNTLASFDAQYSTVDSYIKHATASSMLCQMPPTWHPWL